MKLFPTLKDVAGKAFFTSSPVLMLLLGISLAFLSLTNAGNKAEADFPSTITQENSSLPSNQIISLCIDSSAVAWIGTDKGLARFDAETMTIYSTENGLAGNQINDLAMDYTANGQQLLMATDQGLSVADVTSDGMENILTYTEENSDLLGSETTNVVIDSKHTRWISTKKAVNVWDGEQWLHQTTAIDGDEQTFNFAESLVSDMAYYAYDSLTLISTAGRGIVRMRYNKVDGITGASTFGLPWATLRSNNISSIAVKGVDQWYGGDSGVDYHASRYTKNDWENFSTENHLLDNTITCVAVDEPGNIWIGTSKGISIITYDRMVLKYTEAEGLINNQVNTLTTDTKGNVWAGTAGGVQWFDHNPGIDATTSNPLHLLNPEIAVYPNPASDFVQLKLHLKSLEKVKVSLYNCSGQLVSVAYNSVLPQNQSVLKLDVSDRNIFRKGIYLIRIDSDRYTQLTKLSIQ